MAETLKPKERLQWVGSTALRAPDGTFLPSVPLYIKVPASTVNPNSGLSAGEEELLDDIAAVLVPRFKQYIDGIEAMKRAQRSKKESRPQRQ